MPLSDGTRLGRYEIRSQLGVGGWASGLATTRQDQFRESTGTARRIPLSGLTSRSSVKK